MTLGHPRVHCAVTGSTNVDAQALALAGAPHGTLVTAGEQRDGRGRQGRRWHAPPGAALLCSLVLRDPPTLLTIVAGVAVAAAIGPHARLKWPNDVLVDARKVGGILVWGRPQERWAVVGVGVNVAVTLGQMPPELRERAGTLGRDPGAVEPLLERSLALLDRWLALPPAQALDAWRDRDALLAAPLTWNGGTGVGAGIDDRGRLLVRTPDGGVHALDAGEVHLGS